MVGVLFANFAMYQHLITMNKKFVMASLMIWVCLSAVAEKTTVPIKGYKGNNTQTEQPIKHRAPMNLPIEAVYDSDTMTIEVACATDLEGELYVYDASEVLEDYSPCLNTVLSVTNSDYHTIVIEGDGWAGYGVIE